MPSARSDRIELHHVWPNVARTSTVPPEGIQGHVIYGGNARLNELNGRSVGGSILVLEYNCGSNWVTAFDLGAKAVIFLEPSSTHRHEGVHKFLCTPADLPRYYASANGALQLRQLAKKGTSHGRLMGRMTWELTPATTLVGI